MFPDTSSSVLARNRSMYGSFASMACLDILAFTSSLLFSNLLSHTMCKQSCKFTRPAKLTGHLGDETFDAMNCTRTNNRNSQPPRVNTQETNHKRNKQALDQKAYKTYANADKSNTKPKPTGCSSLKNRQIEQGSTSHQTHYTLCSKKVTPKFKSL